MNHVSVKCIVAALLLLSRAAVAQRPIPIAAVNRNGSVSFEKDVLPILQKSCLGCHSVQEANGDLSLETPATILKGGDNGPAVVPGNGAKSLLLKLASHQAEPLMPPPDNDVAAKPLTSRQLGLIKLWIDQGAKGSAVSGYHSPRRWRPLPPGKHPIYAVAVSPDGQYAACGRANQIFIYHVPTGKLLTRLTDPELQESAKDPRPGVAHLDVVQSLVFNKQGDMLASGGFRTAKLWRYPRDVKRRSWKMTAAIHAVAVSPDRETVAIGGADGVIKLWPVENKLQTPEEESPALLLQGHAGEVRGLCFARYGRLLISASADKTIRVWSTSDGELLGRIDTADEVNGVATFLDLESSERIVSAGADKLLRVWSVPRQLPQPLAGASSTTSVLAASRDGKLLGMSGASGLVRVIRADTRQKIHQWQAHAGAVHDVAFHVPVVAEQQKAQDPAANEKTSSFPRAATAGDDGAVRLWNCQTGEELLVLRGSLSPVQSVDIRPDGKQLAAGAADGAVTVWSVEPAAPQAFEKAAAPATAAVVSPDGKLLATNGVLDGRPAIFVRQLDSGKITRTFLGHEATILSLAFSNDNTRIVSSSADKTARVWDLKDPKFPELARFTGHGAAVTAAAFNSDGSQVLSGSDDKSVKLWKVAGAEEVKNFAGHAAPVVAVAMPANNQPISASADKTIRFWNPANGQAIRTLTEAAPVAALALSRDSQRVAVAVADKTVKVYPTANGNALLTLSGHQDVVKSLTFSPDNKRLVSGGADNAALVWDMADGRLLEIFPLAESKLTAATYGPAPDRVLLADSDGGVAIHPLRFAGAVRGISKPVTAVRYNANGQLLLTACEDGTVRGFNGTNFQQTFAANHGAPVHGLAISPNGQRMASAGEDKLVKLWNPANGGQIQPPQLTGFTAPVHSVCFSRDSNRLVAGSSAENGEVLVFNVAASGLLEQSIVGHAGAVAACAVTPEYAVSTSSDGKVLTWELLAVRHIAGHSQSVTSVTALPPQPQQPPQIVSSSADGTLRRWNAQTGQQIAQLNHGAPVTAVTVRGDGQRLASASSNNTIKLWNAANNQQLAEMRGDLRAKTLVAKLTRFKNDATAKVTASKAAFDAAEKDLPVKTTAEKTASDALAAATKDVETKAAALSAASSTKANAEKLAIEAAAVAQKAAVALENANRRALELAAKAQLLSQKSARAKAAADVDPNNAALAKVAMDAGKLVVVAQAETKGAEATKPPLAKTATAMAQAAAAAAQKALATNKPFADAATALAQSQAAQRAARQAHEVAARDLKLAQAVVPTTKARLAKVEAELKQVVAELAKAVKAEAEAQQPIRCLAFSPDGRTVASGGDFGVVHTWDAGTGKAVSSYAGHAAAVQSVAYLSDGALVSASGDKNAVVWELSPNWRLERVLGGINDPTSLMDRVMSLDFSPDGALLATGGGVPSREGEVKTWDVSSGKLVRAFAEPHTDTVNGVTFSPDGQYVASAAADKYVKKFDVATGEQLAQFEGHTNHVLGVSWRANGAILASCGADGTIRTWNAKTGDRIRSIAGFNKQVTAVRFMGQTQFMVTTSGDPFVRKYNSDNGGVQTSFTGSADYMYSIDATDDPNNGVVVAGGHDGLLRIWRANGPSLHVIGLPQTAESVASLK